MNRTTNQGMLDANSQLPISFIVSPLINTSNAPGVIAVGAGIFHGFVIQGLGVGSWGAEVYDALITGTLNSTTSVGVLTTSTSGGAYGFQWGGDVVFTNGLVVKQATGTTAGAIKILYL